MQVKDIMHSVATIDSKLKVSDGIVEMSKKHIDCLIVTSSNKIVGMVTEDDIFTNLDKTDNKITDIMIKDIKTIDAGEELNEAAETMNREGVRKLPVLSKGKLVGIITATDLIAHAGELSEVFLFD